MAYGEKVQECFESIRDQEQRLSTLRKRKIIVENKVEALQRKITKLKVSPKPKVGISAVASRSQGANIPTEQRIHGA